MLGTLEADSVVTLTENPRPLTLAIIASQFAPPFMFSGVSVALPALGKELAAGGTAIGLVETTFLASSLVLMLPMGRLSDLGDKRSLYKVGLWCFALASLAIAMLSWMPGILLARVIQGMSSAMISTTGPAILAEIVPASHRGRAFGASIGAAYAGLTIGPMGAGVLCEHFGWRSVFVCGGLVLLAGAILMRSMMESRWRPLRGTVDLPSAVTWGAIVVAFVAASTTIERMHVGMACAGAGVVLSLLFLRLQRSVNRPLIDVELLRNRPLARALIVQLLLYMNAFASIFLLSIFTQVSLHHSALVAGRVLALGTLVMALLAPFAGMLADRYPPRFVSAAGVACVFVTTLIARSLGPDARLRDVALALGIQSVGFALFSTPNMKAIMGAVAPERIGMASALGATSRSLGMVSGMLVIGSLIARAYGHEPIVNHPERFIDLLTRAYTVFTVFVGVALLISLFALRREGTREVSPRN